MRAISADAAHFKTANHPDLASLPLSGKFFGRAAFPILLFEDIRILGNVLVTPVDQLWRQFSLAPLNYDVSMPLTGCRFDLIDTLDTILSSSILLTRKHIVLTYANTLR